MSSTSLGPRSLINKKLVGNLGSLQVLPDIDISLITGNILETAGYVSLAKAKTLDDTIIPISVTTIVTNETVLRNSASGIFKFIKLIWGGGGTAIQSKLLDPISSVVFTVHAAEIEVKAISAFIAPAPTGQSVMGAFLSEGYSEHGYMYGGGSELGNAGPGTVTAGNTTNIRIQPFVKDIMFVPEFDSTWTIQFREASTGTTINTIHLSPNVISPWIPIHGFINSVAITNTTAVDKTIYAYQRITM